VKVDHLRKLNTTSDAQHSVTQSATTTNNRIIYSQSIAVSDNTLCTKKLSAGINVGITGRVLMCKIKILQNMCKSCNVLSVMKSRWRLELVTRRTEEHFALMLQRKQQLRPRIAAAISRRR